MSLLKEYKREVLRYVAGERDGYPVFPENYIKPRDQAILNEYHQRLDVALAQGKAGPDFPEKLVAERIENTWHDAAEGIVGNWIGLVYQLTHADRRKLFMGGVDPDDPLGLRHDPARLRA